MSKNAQEKFWQNDFGKGYIERNSHFDHLGAETAWRKMLGKAEGVGSVLECGSNIGRNLQTLRKVLPDAALSLIEINKEAHDLAVRNVRPERSFNGSILESDYAPGSFDLTFTCGVLIHIHPDHLLANCRKIVDYSKRYVLAAEYFNRTPVMIPYHGEADRLFKRDFGKFYLENFDLDVVDYGFLWSRDNERAGFDDITWWLFEKK